MTARKTTAIRVTIRRMKAAKTGDTTNVAVWAFALAASAAAAGVVVKRKKEN